MSESPDEYCTRELRSADPDRWLTTLFAPDARRPGLHALYAFNAEIARAREAVSQPMIGQIRLQWWREAWEGIWDNRPRNHPVVMALHVHCRNLDRGDVFALIDARETDMEEAPPANMDALCKYAEASSAPLMRMACDLLEEEIDDETLRLAGTGYALTGILRATSHFAAQRRIYLPADRLAAAGLMPESLYQSGLGPAAIAVIAEVGREAEKLFASLRQRRISRRAMAAVLPATIARTHLRQLAKAGFNPDVPGASASATRLHVALLAALWRRRI
jgi:NADH dehydrogenase [ubiquinone] 1 alpha subcomplex assembly factor 6